VLSSTHSTDTQQLGVRLMALGTTRHPDMSPNVLHALARLLRVEIANELRMPLRGGGRQERLKARFMRVWPFTIAVIALSMLLPASGIRPMARAISVVSK
jgi:hypothetical protein